jgi:hypothetical protein
VKVHKLAIELMAEGQLSEERINSWREMADLLAMIDMMGRNGVSAVIKIDGVRSGGDGYTVAISGPPLGEDFFRKDGSDLAELLVAAITFYRDKTRADPSNR